MITNGTEIAAEIRPAHDKLPAYRRSFENGAPEGEHLAKGAVSEPPESTEDFALAPLVNKIAHGVALGLVEAVKELEQHITSETRKVADKIDRRLDALQVSMQDLVNFVSEQRPINSAVQDRLEQLVNADAQLREADVRQVQELTAVREQTAELSTTLTQEIEGSRALLKEADARQTAELDALRAETGASARAAAERFDAAAASDARQAAELAALQNETKALSQSVAERIESVCRELGVHQEDISAGKNSMGTVYSRIDTLVERLDRQAEAVRSMHTAYSQRENELEQLVDGLARLRAFSTPLPSNGL